MKKRMEIFGHQVSIRPVKNSQSDQDLALEGSKILKDYFAAKQMLDQKIVENQKWWKGRHWDLFRAKHSKNDPEPVTMYLFNMLANKHADAMDNYPDFNILARKAEDAVEAEKLSKIVPVVYQYNFFRKTYSRAWWYKLINGCSVYGQFWDPDLMEGLGDISLSRLDILNLAWEPGITDIQDSRNFFIIGLEDNDLLREAYKEVLDEGDLLESKKIINPREYAYDDYIDTSKKSVVVDWYRRMKGPDGRVQLHLVKFVGDKILVNSQADEKYASRGLYDHGLYPVVFDVLFPLEGYPVGFGVVDIAKNPQMYIDKLDQIISKNALLSGKQRWFIKRSGGIKKEDVMDFSQDVIEVEGQLSEEHIREFQAKTLDHFIIEHRNAKIMEMKEITGSTEFTRGEGGKGVTAAAAIYALQEAGNKLARDMIGETYENLVSLAYMTIENIRQFYDAERDFRIHGDDGEYIYQSYSNEGIKPQALPPAYENEGFLPDPETGEMVPDPDFKGKYRKPIFDIQIIPEKKSPYSKAVHNEMATQFFQLGMFNPQRAPEARLAMEMMSFEGRDNMIQRISENGLLMQQFQQIVGQMQGEMGKMWEVIQRLGGEKLLGKEEVANAGEGTGQEEGVIATTPMQEL